MRQPEKKMSLLMGIALVTGTMIGSGVFLLPASLAGFGGISILGWIFSTAGALLLAFTLSSLSRKIPRAGGPYAFTTVAFGDFVGFLVGWGYWISLLTGSAAIAVAAVGYLGVFLEGLAQNQLLAGMAALGLIWIVTWINISGVRQAGIIQVIMTILKILPLILVIVLGIFYFEIDHFVPFNLSGTNGFSAVTSTATLTLWAFLGLEAATVAAENVRDPEKNVPRSTVTGTLVAAVIYILGTTAVMGIISPEELQTSTAPFADAARRILGRGAGYFIAAGAIISCIGALNGMVMLQGQMPFAFSRDRLFHPLFKKLTRIGTPGNALILSALLVTIFIGLNYARSLVDLFTYIIRLSTLSILLPYAFSTMAEILLLKREQQRIPTPRLARSVIIALLAFAYSIWTISGAGSAVVYLGFILFLMGMPFYVWFQWIYGDGKDRDSMDLRK